MRLLISSILAFSLMSSTTALAVPNDRNPRSLELNEQGVKLVNSGKFQDAEDTFRAALNADPGNLTAVFNLAGMFIQNKKEGLAVDILQKYAKENPADPALQARLGDAFFVKKDLQSAYNYYSAAYKLDPKYPGVAGKLGTLHAMGKQLTEAEKMFQEAVTLEPKNAQFLANYSSLLLANKKPKEAVVAAKRSLQVAPSSETYVTLAAAYEDLRDKKNALAAYERAKELGDKRPELEKKIADLKK